MDLETALRKVDETTTLSASAKREIAGNCRNLAKRLQRSPSALRIDCRSLQRQLGELTPAGLGISESRLHNLRASWRAMLRIAHPEFVCCGGLPPEWTRLSGMLEAHHRRREKSWELGPFRPFMRFAAAQGVTPDRVSNELLEAYGERHAALHPERNTARVLRNIRNLWEDARREIEGWPQAPLPKPARQDHHALPLDDFPASFRRDLDAYVSHKGLRPPTEAEGAVDGGDASSADSYLSRARRRLAHAHHDKHGRIRLPRPLSDASIRTQRYIAILAASAMVKSGKLTADQVTELSVVATPQVAATLLKDVRQRQEQRGKAQGSYQVRILSCLMSVGERWGGLSEENRQLFKAMLANARDENPNQGGMSSRVMSRLGPFHNVENVVALYELPDGLFARIEQRRRKRGATVEDARLAEVAVAILISFIDPLRRENLASLHLDDSFVWPEKSRQPARVFVERSQVKNGRDLHALIPAARLRLISIHLEHYRPLLSMNRENRYLFPPRRGATEAASKRPRDADALGTSIQKVIRRELGLHVNPHLFRTICALVLYEFSDGNRRLVEDVLGHQPNSTVTEHYLQISQSWASSKLQEAFEAQRQTLHEQKHGRRRTRRTQGA